MLPPSSFRRPPLPASTVFPYATLFRSPFHFGAPLVAQAAGGTPTTFDCSDTHVISVPEKSSVVGVPPAAFATRSEEDTSELQSPMQIVCRLLLGKKERDKAAGAGCERN